MIKLIFVYLKTLNLCYKQSNRQLMLLLFILLYYNPICSCQAVSDKYVNSINRKHEDDFGTGSPTAMGLYVGEVLSDSVASATGQDNVASVPYNTFSRSFSGGNINNERLPYDVITFSNQNLIQGSEKRTTNNGFSTANEYPKNIQESKDFNANLQPKSIIGTKNLIDFVNAQIEQDAKTGNSFIDDSKKVQQNGKDLKYDSPSVFRLPNGENFQQVRDHGKELNYNWYPSNLNKPNKISNHKNYLTPYFGADNIKRVDTSEKQFVEIDRLKKHRDEEIDEQKNAIGNERIGVDLENFDESEQNTGNVENNSDYFGNDDLDSGRPTPNRSERLEGDDEEDAFQPPPKDHDEDRVRNFVSDHEFPREVPTKLNYQGGGAWAKPAPGSGIKIDFVPQQIYTQTRHTSTVKFLPQEEALAEASTPEEIINAPRLREVISHKKTQEVYEEEGYEDTAYDHGGYKKNAKAFEDHNKNSLAYIPEDDVAANVPDQKAALNDHEKFLPRSSGTKDHETQGSGQQQVVQKTTPFGTPKVRKWKTEKTTSNQKSVRFLNSQGKSDVRVDKPEPVRQGTIGRSVEYKKVKTQPDRIPGEVLDLLQDSNKKQKKLPINRARQQPIINLQNYQVQSKILPQNQLGSSKISVKRNPQNDNHHENTELLKLHKNIEPERKLTDRNRNSERLEERKNAYTRQRNPNKNTDNENRSKTLKTPTVVQDSTESDDERDKIINSKLKELQKTYSNAGQETNDEDSPEEEDDIKIDPNHPSSFYSGSFVYNKPRMVKLKKSGLPVDASITTDYGEESEETDTNSRNVNEKDPTRNRDKANNHQHIRLSTGRHKHYREPDSRQHQKQEPHTTFKNHKASNLRNNYKQSNDEQGRYTKLPINNNSPTGILSQWTTPLLNPLHHIYNNEPVSSLGKRNPINNQFHTAPVFDLTSSQGIGSRFPTWSDQTSLFESIPERFETGSPFAPFSRSLYSGTNPTGEPLYTDTTNPQPDWIPINPQTLNTKPTDSTVSQSQSIKTTMESTNVPVNEKDNHKSMFIDQLTHAHYSSPSNTNLYKVDSQTKLDRMLLLADELNKPVKKYSETDVKDDVTDIPEEGKKLQTSIRQKRNIDETYDNDNSDEEENDDRRKYLANQYQNYKFPKNVELVGVKSEGTTEIPVDVFKYPFYRSSPSEGLEKYSPLRYATNPNFIPKKSGTGMEFYESRDHIECEEPTPPKDIVPKRNEDGEWNERPMPDGPRIKGLGDKIQCLRIKYFGKDPLDNPFFKEDSVSVPNVFKGERRSDIEDQLGLYVDIMSNIKSNSDHGYNLNPNVRRPTRNITLNDKFKGYGKKYMNGYKPYYGKFNKYSSTYNKDNFKQKIHQNHHNPNRGENKYTEEHMKIINDAHSSSTNNLNNHKDVNNISLQNNQNNSPAVHNDENFDSFIPSYLPVRDDTVAINNYKNNYNNACKHYEYLLKPLMTMTPPPAASPQTYHVDERKKRKSIPPKLYPTSIYSVLNNGDNRNQHNHGARFVRGSKFNIRQPIKFSYARPKNHRNTDSTGSSSIFHTKIHIKGIDQLPNNKHAAQNAQFLHQYYTIIARPKRQIHQTPVLYFDIMMKNQKRAEKIRDKRSLLDHIIKKRNLNIDQLTLPVQEMPTENFPNKYHKIISRNDRNNDSTTTEETVTERPFKKLNQEVFLTLNVRDPENVTQTDNERPQRMVESVTNHSTIDTMVSGSHKVETEQVIVKTNDKTEDDSKNKPGSVSRLSGGFISRHSPAYSSKYKKNQQQDNSTESTISTESSSHLTTEKISYAMTEPTVFSTEGSTSNDVSTTTSGRLKVRFPKLTAKPTVAIVPEDHTKSSKAKSSAPKPLNKVTTTSTTTTTTPSSFTTTRMYKPKRVYKKENNRNSRIVDAFAVLNRQRDGSSEKNSNQNFGTSMTTTIISETTYQEPVTTSTRFDTTDPPTTRRNFRPRNNNQPRNFQMDQRRVTQEEVIKKSFKSHEDENNPNHNTKDVTSLFDHPDLRDPTARVGKNIDYQRHDEVGASSNKDETIINDAIMYVVNPATGFGHWEAEQRLQTRNPSINQSPKKENRNLNNRNKSRYQDSDRANKNQERSYARTAVQSATSNNFSTHSQRGTIKESSAQRDSSRNKERNNRRPVGKVIRNKQAEPMVTIAPGADKEVIMVRNLFTQIPPYGTVATFYDEEIDADDVGHGIVIDTKRLDSSTPKIIMEPDKRMYYYLPE